MSIQNSYIRYDDNKIMFINVSILLACNVDMSVCTRYVIGHYELRLVKNRFVTNPICLRKTYKRVFFFLISNIRRLQNVWFIKTVRFTNSADERLEKLIVCQSHQVNMY